MSAEPEDYPNTGLVPRYRVERLHDPEGKHSACEYFVLDPTHDPIARQVMMRYAQLAAAEGRLELAADLENMVSRCTIAGEAKESQRTLREMEQIAALRRDKSDLMAQLNDDLAGEHRTSDQRGYSDEYDTRPDPSEL